MMYHIETVRERGHAEKAEQVIVCLEYLYQELYTGKELLSLKLLKETIAALKQERLESRDCKASKSLL